MNTIAPRSPPARPDHRDDQLAALDSWESIDDHGAMAGGSRQSAPHSPAPAARTPPAMNTDPDPPDISRTATGNFTAVSCAVSDRGIEFGADTDDPERVKPTSGLPEGISRAEIPCRTDGGRGAPEQVILG